MIIRKRDVITILEMILILLCFYMITWAATLGFLGIFCGIVIFLAIISINLFKVQTDYELSTVIALPIMLSAFQNVYMGIFSLRLSNTSIQVITILNFLFVCILFLIIILQKSKFLKSNKIYLVLITIILYSFITFVLFEKTNVISMISSLRNIISIFLFYIIGIILTKKIDMNKFQRIILFIALVVIIVGFYEVSSKGEMWNSLHITDLWTKKGIRVQSSSGLPTNFYSSEKINGERIRRMVSTFADPVNLGTFLYAVFCITWYRKKRILGILVVISIALTVSKGALLGILLFLCIYTYFYWKKPAFFLMTGFVVMCGIAFLVYANVTSANSVFLHLSGLMSAFRSLLTHPFGLGIGNTGVLAYQFSRYSSNLSITETGLGMIIGQLGIIGLSLYITFFYKVTKACFKFGDIRDKVFCLALILSIITNIFFNEVALSPNSCAIYFLIVGCYVGKFEHLTKNDYMIHSE